MVIGSIEASGTSSDHVVGCSQQGMSDSLDMLPRVAPKSSLEDLDGGVCTYDMRVFNLTRSSGNWYAMIVEEESELLIILWVYPGFNSMKM